jgi:hypothetical protein
MLVERQEMSRIKRINKIKISSETLHNLEVKDDESYVADGIVVHNCRSYMEPIYKSEDQPSIDDAIAPPSIREGKTIF